MFERKKVGLALSGGGASGLAHIGVLKILEKHKIPIDFIAGTSMGAVIAAMYSAEPNAKKLEKEAQELDWKNIFDYTIPKSGLIRGQKIEGILENKLHNLQFSQLKIPLYITAFDIEKSQEVIFNKGDVAKAVRASISIPGIFVPVINNNRILVDGGVIDPIPSEILKKQGAEIIIAVNVVSFHPKSSVFETAVVKKSKKKIPNIVTITSKTLKVMEAETYESDLKSDKIDLIISPNIPGVGLFDFHKIKEIIKKGESQTISSLKEIQKITEPNPFKAFLNELNESLNVKKLVNQVKEISK
jgi:NTE family protein